MDALKLISQSSMKAELPVVNVGDTVRVSVKIKEGDKERSQMFEGTVIAKKHEGINETLPFAALRTVLALSVFSRSTLPTLRALRLSAAVKFAVRNSTICVTVLVKPLRSKKRFANVFFSESSLSKRLLFVFEILFEVACGRPRKQSPLDEKQLYLANNGVSFLCHGAFPFGCFPCLNRVK